MHIYTIPNSIQSLSRVSDHTLLTKDTQQSWRMMLTRFGAKTLRRQHKMKTQGMRFLNLHEYQSKEVRLLHRRRHRNEKTRSSIRSSRRSRSIEKNIQKNNTTMPLVHHPSKTQPITVQSFCVIKYTLTHSHKRYRHSHGKKKYSH